MNATDSTKATQTKRTFVSFRDVGGAYHNGMKHSGWLNLIDTEGNTLYFSEGTPWDVAMKQAEQMGYDCQQLRARLDRWVKTGSATTAKSTAYDH